MAVINIEGTGKFFCPDGENLLRALLNADALLENPCGGRGTCGKCRVQVAADTGVNDDDGHVPPGIGSSDIPGISGISEITAEERRFLTPAELANGIRLACMTCVTGACRVRLPGKETGARILTGGRLPEFSRDALDGFGAAADIGTTTVALTLVDLKTGAELSSASAVNPQKSYGLDVLTRISFEYEQGDAAINALRTAIVGCLNELLAETCRRAGISVRDLSKISVAANCTMTHMLLGIDARSLGRAPYTPVFTAARECIASEIGIIAGEQTRLYCLPQVSAYIGGDITAGVAACRLKEQTGSVLFIDIGTNGEIVLAHEGRLLCCSCAAGPALEGMNISCGMRAADGAVEEVRIEAPAGDGQTGGPVTLKTIGDAPPAGFCGSGILSAVKELIKHGYIKRTGAFVPVDAQPEPRLLHANGTRREAVFSSTPLLRVTQEDVRQVQLAKGAIRSGFAVLLSEAGITAADLDRVIVAGQFGAHLPAESLTGIGLLPAELSDRLVYSGNTSMAGAYMALLSAAEREKMEDTAKAMSYIDLSRTENYEQIFAKAMAFPSS